MRLLLLALAVAPALAAEPLPALRADTAKLTASGLSSGGYMAVQLHVAHSARVVGVGAVAAGPYYCAQGSLWTALYNCMKPGWWTPLPGVEVLKRETDALASRGRVDAPSHLAAARVWLLSGTRDRTVYPAVVEALRDYYARYGAKPHLVADLAAGHAMPTENAGNSSCAATDAPYLNDCDFDAAGKLLEHLLGPLKGPGSAGAPREFDQRPYAEGARMGDTGFVYVPRGCESGGCKVHVAFHGCRQSAGQVGDRFAREAGYNRWAETNRLIVLYPQARSSWSPFAFNPRACWDWWGYSGADYHTREGAQIRAVVRMVERLAAGN